MSNAYRLTFQLPRAMLLLVPEGRHQPCLAGVVLRVARGMVTVEGLSGESVREQAARLLRTHGKKFPAFAIAAVLETPSRGGRAPVRDGWTITLNSEVTFTPGPIAEIRPLRDRDVLPGAEPEYTIMSAG